MGPKKNPSKKAVEFERRFLAANPKHSTEYATLGNDKVTVQLKLKRVREQVNNKIFIGAVMVISTTSPTLSLQQTSFS